MTVVSARLDVLVEGTYMVTYSATLLPSGDSPAYNCYIEANNSGVSTVLSSEGRTNAEYDTTISGNGYVTLQAGQWVDLACERTTSDYRVGRTSIILTQVSTVQEATQV